MSKGTEPRRTNERKRPELPPAPAPEPRKPFSIPRPVALEGKTYCVVSGYVKQPIDGHWPHISVHNLMRVFNLKPRECLCVDERQTSVIEAAKAAGLKLVTVEEYTLGQLFE